MPSLHGGSPLDTARQAVIALESLALPSRSDGSPQPLRLVGVSRWYESAPIPPSGQPPYINAVAHLRGDVDPVDLLTALQRIEQAAGRQRGAANAARTLDLDIVAIGDLVRIAPDPIIPHPRAHLRAFVLLPLADVLPDWIHPIYQVGIADLLARLPAQTIHAL